MRSWNRARQRHDCGITLQDNVGRTLRDIIECNQVLPEPSALGISAARSIPDRGMATFSFFLSPFSHIRCTQSEAKIIERYTARAAWRSYFFLLRGRNFAVGLSPFSFCLLPFYFAVACDT